ncbi:MAG: hypothetical protein ACKN9D_11140, partial [Actinomycetales bacterium]
AITEVLAAKAMAALEQTGLTQLVVAGGVGANRRLRERLDTATAALGCRVFYPPFELCTDNGAMIATLGAWLVERGASPSPWSVGADPGLPITSVQIVAHEGRSGDSPN